MRRLTFSVFLLLALLGCTVSNHGVFPKLVWYWSKDAQLEREYHDPAYIAAARTRNEDNRARVEDYLRTNTAGRKQ